MIPKATGGLLFGYIMQYFELLLNEGKNIGNVYMYCFNVDLSLTWHVLNCFPGKDCRWLYNTVV